MLNDCYYTVEEVDIDGRLQKPGALNLSKSQTVYSFDEIA